MSLKKQSLNVIDYADDFSANFDDNSLITKKYFQDNASIGTTPLQSETFNGLMSGFTITRISNVVPSLVIMDGVAWDLSDLVISGFDITFPREFGPGSGEDLTLGSQAIVFWGDVNGGQTVNQSTTTVNNVYVTGTGGGLVPEIVNSTPVTLNVATTLAHVAIDIPDITLPAAYPINQPLQFINSVGSGNNAVINMPTGEFLNDGIMTSTVYVLNTGYALTFVKVSSTIWTSY